MLLEIITFLGGTSVFVAGTAWLIRQIVKQFLDKDIESYKNKLVFEKEKNSITYKEKIALYKEVSEPIIDLIVKIEHRQPRSTEEWQEIIKSFDKERLSITAQLAMFAPQNVFDDYNNMIDYMYDAFEGKDTYSFQVFRETYAMKFLSSMRKDIGIYTDDIFYNGHR